MRGAAGLPPAPGHDPDLRRARLARAHRELRDATPGDGVTVTGVAARCGFTPSRFTERYRAAYGVLPSRTLRT